MGFNVSVSAKEYRYQQNLAVFINRSYYNFVASYQVDLNESILIETGKYLGLDLRPLTRLVYNDDDFSAESSEAYLEEYLLNTEDVLSLAKSLYQKIKDHPNIFLQIPYSDARKAAIWQNYGSSGQIYEDLENLIQAIQVFKDAGFERIYFVAS